MNAALHFCDADPLDLGRLVYLPALDPEAVAIPGGARVLTPLSIASIPEFDYDPRQDGPCWICAYGEALRRRRVEPPPNTDGVVVDEAAMKLRASALLRGLAGVAKRTLAQTDVASASASEIILDASAILRGLAKRAFVQTDVMHRAAPNVVATPERVDVSVASPTSSLKKKQKPGDGGGGQQGLF